MFSGLKSVEEQMRINICSTTSSVKLRWPSGCFLVFYPSVLQTEERERWEIWCLLFENAFKACAGEL